MTDADGEVMQASATPEDRVNATILSDVRCHLGEGATYNAQTGTAWRAERALPR
jgi:hypothetical protein